MPTLTLYRRALADRIGKYGVFTTTGVGSTTTVVCTTAFAASSLPTDALAGAWVFVPGGTLPRQRRVTPTGVNTATGTLTLDGALGAAPGTSTNVEIHGRMPPADEGSEGPGTSLHQCLNLALRHMWAPDRLDVTSVANAFSYSLSTYAAWLDSPDRIEAVYDPPRAAGYPLRPTGRRWELRLDGGTPTLQFIDRAYPVAGATFQIAVRRPAESLISGAESTAGLSAEADTATLPVADVVICALPFAYAGLADARTGARRAEYRALAADALATARRNRWWDTTRDDLGAAPRAEAA